MQSHRPLGVTIIAILTIIGGILLVLGGVALIAVGALISVAPPHTSAAIFGVISAAIWSVLLVVGIGYLVMFYGLLKGKGWAWTITIILIFIGIAIQIISTTSAAVFNSSLASSGSSSTNTVISGIIGGIIGIAVNVAVIYYLYRPNVRAFFGKASRSARNS